MKLEGKKAVITGGNSGIGLATARLFIQEGAEVAITGRDPKTLEEAERLLGPRAVAYRADVTDSAARKEMFVKIGSASASWISYSPTPGFPEGHRRGQRTKHCSTRSCTRI